MRKINKVIAIALSVLCCGSMSACVGRGNSGGGDNELSFFVRNTVKEIATINQMTTAFKTKIKEEEGRDITIKIKTLSDATYNKDMLNAIQSKDLSDIITITDEYLENWAMKGTLENLDSYFAQSNFDFTKHDTAAFDISKCVGRQGEKHLYMVPRTYDQPLFAVNVDLWNELMGEGVALPVADETWTWSKLMGIFEDLREAMDEKYNKNSSTYVPLDVQLGWQAFYDPFIRSFGGYVYEAENESVGMNTPGTRKALEKLKTMVESKYIPPVSSGSYFFGNKATMFLISRPYLTDWMTDYNIDNIAFLPIPIYDSAFTGIENGTSYYAYGSVGFAMNSASKNKDLAYKYFEFTLSEEGQGIWSRSGLAVPTLLSIQQQENAEWKTPYSFLQGVDQSAFTFTDYKKDCYTRIQATYARTGNTDRTYESGFYDEVTAIFATLGTKSLDNFIGTAQDQLVRFIG